MVVKNADSIDKNISDQLTELGDEYESKISRGIAFRFMWLDATAESEFTSVFGLGDNYPSVVILNPGKRKRFLTHEGEITSAGIQKTLDKILGGDARFKNIKGNALPKLVSMYPLPESK